jgi:phosphatidylserine/phosphatidylglycerophosphate/cardiolipin synthase-like enzyme
VGGRSAPLLRRFCPSAPISGEPIASSWLMLFPLLTTALLLSGQDPAAIDERAAVQRLTLVESSPLETSLDSPDLPQTADVWKGMIVGARSELLLSHFYASTAPRSPLNDVIASIEAAARRGVRVRFLLAERFRKTYPELAQRLGQVDGIDVRFVDYGEVAGGVMHAKYMVADGEQSFLGSPNFDFRAMDQIQELGAHLVDRSIAEGLSRIFEMDWALAGGEAAPTGAAALAPSKLTLAADQAGDAAPSVKATLACSPEGHLPGGVPWDLPLLLELIDSAEARLRVQVLTYDATGYGGGFFDRLESALRRAAARGVRVELLVADWCKRRGCVDGLQSLASLDGIDVRFAVIPDASTGFVEFSRVAHAKLCVADERAAWIGSSNWEGSYFTTSRNVSLFLEGAGVGARLARWFDTTFQGEYAEPVVPGKSYEPRRRQ